jgi:hypothetical protein
VHGITAGALTVTFDKAARTRVILAEAIRRGEYRALKTREPADRRTATCSQ